MHRAMILAVLLFATAASAQTPVPRPNIPLVLVGEIRAMACHGLADPDAAQMCFVRTDLPEIVELGCTPLGPDRDMPGDTALIRGCEALVPADGLPSCVGRLDLNVAATSGVDAEIRCYAVDTSGLVSDYSENAGTVDFTRPGRPWVQ